MNHESQARCSGASCPEVAPPPPPSRTTNHVSRITHPIHLALKGFVDMLEEGDLEHAENFATELLAQTRLERLKRAAAADGVVQHLNP